MSAFVTAHHPTARRSPIGSGSFPASRSLRVCCRHRWLPCNSPEAGRSFRAPNRSRYIGSASPRPAQGRGSARSQCATSDLPPDGLLGFVHCSSGCGAGQRVHSRDRDRAVHSACFADPAVGAYASAGRRGLFSAPDRPFSPRSKVLVPSVQMLAGEKDQDRLPAAESGQEEKSAAADSARPRVPLVRESGSVALAAETPLVLKTRTHPRGIGPPGARIRSVEIATRPSHHAPPPQLRLFPSGTLSGSLRLPLAASRVVNPPRDRAHAHDRLRKAL